MDIQTDEDEHSIEMHLPYVRKIFEGYKVTYMCKKASLTAVVRLDISVVPILVGAIDKDKEVAFGQLLAPYLSREDTFCVISSDFCHWCAPAS